MHTYKLTVKQIKAVGGDLSSLDDSRKLIFKGAIQMMVGLLNATDEVVAAKAADDYSIEVTTKEDMNNAFKEKLSATCEIEKLH